MAARPGNELEPSRRIRHRCVDADSIEALIGRLLRVLVAMTADPRPAVVVVDVLDAAEHARLDELGQPGGADPARTPRGVDSGVVRRAGCARPGSGGGDLRRPFVDLPRAR